MSIYQVLLEMLQKYSVPATCTTIDDYFKLHDCYMIHIQSTLMEYLTIESSTRNLVCLDFMLRGLAHNKIGIVETSCVCSVCERF